MSKLRKLSRVAVALGGLLIFVGTIMVVISALAFFDAVNLPIDSEQRLFMWGLLVISLLGSMAGILLVYRRR
jgi:nitrate reductase gamma subunit